MTNALGVFLRARRAALSPTDVGLPTGSRRRTPGLRREELAALAGVSVDYYTRLEQGRETAPSDQVLRALATALRLDAEAAAHLDTLARPPLATTHDADVPEAVLRLVETVRPNPAYVLGRAGDVLAVNPEGLRLMRGLDDWPRERWNSVRWMFTHPAARELLADWAHSAADNVAHLHTQDPHAPEVAALVAELSAASAEFARLWERYEVRAWSGRVKTFHHPEDGELRLVSQSLTLPGGANRLVIYQPAGDGPHENRAA